MEIIIILILVIFFTYIKAVPPNTVIIVDRHTHYLKTKKSGLYFFNPVTDKITTQISTNQVSRSYSEVYETHDGKKVRVSFNTTYHADNLDDVVYALSSARRSIDDIMCSSVYWAVNDLCLDDFSHNNTVLLNEVKPKLLSEAVELRIKIDKFVITSSSPLPYGSNIEPFKPHLSSHSSGPIKFN